MPGGIVENATARYQSQGGIAGRAVNGLRREVGFEVLAHAGDPENSRDPVGECHVDGVSGLQGPEAEEDRRPLIAIDVTFDNRRADLAGRRRVFVPRGLARARDQRRYLDRAVGVEPEVQEWRAHADGRDIHRDRHGALQRWTLAGRPDGTACRRGGLRRMLLGQERDAHRAHPAQDEQDAGHPGQLGPEADLLGRAAESVLRPRGDDAEPGYAGPPRIPQCGLPPGMSYQLA